MADMKVAMVFEAVDRASRVIRGIIGAQEKLNALAARGWGHVTSGAGRAAKGLAVAGAATVGVAASAVAAAKALIEPGRQFERYGVQLAALEGSAERGSAALDWITDFATRTPLELDQVVESYVQLRSFGMDPTNGTMQALLDTMAANGKGAEHLSGIVLAMGQAWTKGKLQGEEAMQLLERGVPVWDLLSEATGKSGAALQKMASDGKLGRDVIQKLIETMGSKYAGASTEMSKSFDGILANIGDAWLQFELAINKAGLFDFMKSKLKEVLDVVNRMSADGTLAELARQVSDTIVTTLTAAWEIARGVVNVLAEVGSGLAWLADAVGGWEHLAAVVAGLALAPALAMIASGIAQVAFGLAMIAPLVLAPIGLVVAAIAAVGAAIYVLVDDWQPVLDWLSSAWDGVVAAAEAAGRWLADVWASITPPEGWSAAFTAAASEAWAGVQSAWAGASTWFSGVWSSITSGFAASVEPIGARVSSIGERFGRIGEAFGRIGERLGRVFERLGTLFGGADSGQLAAFAEGLGRVAGVLADIAALGLDAVVAGVELLVAGLDKLTALAAGDITLDWSALLPALDWSAIVPRLDLAALIGDFRWSDVLPDWDWSTIIPSMPDVGAWFGSGAAAAPIEAAAAAAERLPAALDAANPAALKESARLTGIIAANADKIAAVDTGPAMAALAGIEAAARGLPAIVAAAMAQVVAAVAGVDLTMHGARLMETLAAGIRARAAVVVEAVRAAMAEVRAYLPSSPAKVGPLSDIHKLKFGETIAASIRAAPMVEAMRRAAAATMAAAAIAGPLAPAAAAPGFRAPPAAVAPAGGGVTLHAPLSITINGNAGADVKAEIEAALREHVRTLADLLERERGRRERREH